MIFQCLLIMIGTLIMAFGYSVFLSPNKIVPGGFMGLAQIIHDLLAKTGFNLISISVWYLILNVFLYIYSLKTMGFDFGIKAGVGILSFSLFTSIIESLGFAGKINEQFLAESITIGGGVYILYAIYGGILMGIGIGLVFRGNGSTGGCDMLAVVVNKFFPMITTGQIMMTIDGLVVVASLISYGSLILPLYALITIFVCGKVSDVFVNGVKSLQAYYVLTDKKDEMSTRIMYEIKRGVTNINCEGMYTGKRKDMLFIVLRRFQIMQLKKIVREVDPAAFMFSHSVKDIYGKGFIEINSESKKSKFAIFKKKNKNNTTENNLDEEIIEQKTIAFDRKFNVGDSDLKLESTGLNELDFQSEEVKCNQSNLNINKDVKNDN